VSIQKPVQYIYTAVPQTNIILLVFHTKIRKEVFKHL